MDKKSIDILDILLILGKHKKFIFFTTLIVSIVAVIYVLVIPKYWISTATILPANEQRNQLSFGSSSLLGISSSLLGGSFQTQGLDLLTIMNSRTFAEDVINKFNLISYFEIEDPDTLVVIETAVKELNESVKRIGMNEETGLISIKIETKDRYLSSDIANYYWQKLEKYNLETRMSKGKQKRIFLEKRVEEVKANIIDLSQELLAFQKKHNIIKLEDQTSAIIQSYSELIIQKNKKELDLEFALEFTNSQNPNIDKLKLENQILTNKISELEEIQSNNKFKYILSLNSIPDKALKFANMTMNLGIQKQIYNFLYPQFEQAKIEEIKDLPTLEVIDKAIPSGLRSKPKRAKLCISAFIIALFLSSLLSYSYNQFNSYRSDKYNNKNNSKII